MDADVLYHREVLQSPVQSPYESCFLPDRFYVPGEESVNLCVANGSLVDFRKPIDTVLRCDVQGESVGFFTLSPDISANLLQRGA